MTVILLKLLSLAIYGILILRIYIQSAENNTAMGKRGSKWLRSIVIFNIIYIISYSFYFMAVYTTDNFQNYLIDIHTFFESAFIGYIAYCVYIQPQMLPRVEVREKKVKKAEVASSSKYKNSGLTESYSIELKEKLVTMMENKELFLDSELRLADLAEMLGISVNHTSQLINEHFKMGFSDFVNKYRVKEAEELLLNRNDQDLSITAIAYQSGFNNRASFYNAFKKHFGVTPTEFKAKAR